MIDRILKWFETKFCAHKFNIWTAEEIIGRNGRKVGILLLVQCEKCGKFDSHEHRINRNPQ